MAATFTNFAYSTLATSINNSQLSLTVAAGHGARFPAPTGADYFYATLESALLVREIVKVTARSTDTFTIVRAQDNTTANSFTAGDSVALRLNAAALLGMTAATTIALKSATTDVNVGSATAPTAGQVLVATGDSAATWQTLNQAATNTTNVFTKNQSVASVALIPGASVAVDASLSNNFTLAIGANATFTLQNPTNLTDGMVLNFVLVQDATGGRAVTWGSKYKFPGGAAFTGLSTTGNAIDFVSCYYRASTDQMYCVLNKAYS